MSLVLDDFTLGSSSAHWTCFTDQVMGGVSRGAMALATVNGERALRLRGTVSLERNGGFVQMARPLGAGGSNAFDARAFRGLVLRVCGEPGGYYVHLRTADTSAPWQYYAADLPVSRAWTDIALPWASFAAVSLRAPLNVSRLMRFGVVAGKSAFEADVSVARIALAP